MASSLAGLGPCHRQLEEELEAVIAMASPGTGPISKERVRAPGKAEQGYKSLFLPQGPGNPVFYCLSQSSS